MSEIPAYTLSDGLEVPSIALGTYNLSILRQAAQRKNVILYTGRSMCGREK